MAHTNRQNKCQFQEKTSLTIALRADNYLSDNIETTADGSVKQIIIM